MDALKIGSQNLNCIPGILWYIIGHVGSPFSVIYDRNRITL